jgi:hypothetical protein
MIKTLGLPDMVDLLLASTFCLTQINNSSAIVQPYHLVWAYQVTNLETVQYFFYCESKLATTLEQFFFYKIPSNISNRGSILFLRMPVPHAVALEFHNGRKRLVIRSFILLYSLPCHDENRTTFAVSTRASFEPISKQMRGISSLDV